MICKRMRAAAVLGAEERLVLSIKSIQGETESERPGFSSTISLLKARLDVATLIRPQHREMEARSHGGRSHCSLGWVLLLEAFH